MKLVLNVFGRCKIKHAMLALGLLIMSPQISAQQQKDSLRVLFVGNSYTFVSNMPQLVSLISNKTSTRLITSQSTAGGATLSDHWNGEKGLNTKAVIATGNYDVVVIQEHSMGTILNPQDFLTYSKKLCDLVKTTGAIPYLYVTWAREKVPQYQETITETYKYAAQENECELVLVGEAWKLAKTWRPDVPLFLEDGSHPSALGAFLTACVFAGTLSKELPVTLPSNYFITDAQGEKLNLLWQDALDITFCQKIAQEIIPTTD